jgi:hypothetical protein
MFQPNAELELGAGRIEPELHAARIATDLMLHGRGFRLDVPLQVSYFYSFFLECAPDFKKGQRSRLVHPENQKVFKIFRHIESCDTCIKY